jgi:hypothetical protein
VRHLSRKSKRVLQGLVSLDLVLSVNCNVARALGLGGRKSTPVDVSHWPGKVNGLIQKGSRYEIK